MDGEARQTAANLAKAFQELSRGEETASSMENNLNDLESKIDQLLKALGQDDVDLDVEDQDEEEEKGKSESTSHASSEEKKTAEK
ncbi:hypothetical protein AAP_02282 [Ascosphaera apis ARSEF 7405]|uniref:Uncharacterized protein n=1 Tax=Ascosphaera apis ARSEF 7405 TaxID=392613 RepID=A0A166NZG6_9EURO|nr:hypothetical protein AAP_02282 [Ascosphaera apis ARSEF 7405]